MPARTSAQKITIAQRRAKAMAMRKTGATMEAIAAALSQKMDLKNYNRSRVFEDIDASLKELNQSCTHDTAEYRRQEEERLDDYLFRLAEKIKIGDVNAIDKAIKISESRRKLLGLDAPIQVQVEDIVSAELQALIDGLETLLPGETYSQVLNAISLIGQRAETGGD